MDKKELDFFKDKLIEEKKKIIKSINNISKQEYGSMDMYYTEISGYDNHPGDIGTEVFMMEQDKGFKNKFNDTLYEIESSLEDIRNNSYGICNNCNKEINKERLELIPYVKTCVDCKEENTFLVENRQFVNRTDGIFVRENDRNQVGFDQEDAYQEIIAMNIVDGDLSFSTGDNIGITKEDERDGVEEIENISQEYYDKTIE